MKATFLYLMAALATNAKSALSLRGSLLLQASLMMLNNLMFLIVWWLIFRHVESIRGWALADLLILQGISALGFGLARVFAGGSDEIARRIEDGDLDSWLTQPKPILGQLMISKMQASGIGDIVSAFIMFGLSGALEWWGWLLACFAAVCAGIVLMSFEVIVHALAFWLKQVSSFSRTAAMFLVMFSLYPPSIFGGGLKFVLFTLVPAGFMAYMPTQLVRDPSLLQLGIVAGSTALYAALACWIFSQGLRRYASGSRFGALA